jgi:transcriptional regulator with XRE-family HTH domain
MFLADNLKFLRKRRKKTQDDVAFALQVKRSTLNGYENGIGEPKLERLMALADYYRFSLDDLVRKDLKKLSESKLKALEITDPVQQLTTALVMKSSIRI